MLAAGQSKALIWVASTVCEPTCQVLGPPAGFVLHISLPRLSNVRQKFAVGHCGASRLLVPSTSRLLHADAPPDGSVEDSTRPRPSVATHSVVVGLEL